MILIDKIYYFFPCGLIHIWLILLKIFFISTSWEQNHLLNWNFWRNSLTPSGMELINFFKLKNTKYSIYVDDACNNYSNVILLSAVSSQTSLLSTNWERRLVILVLWLFVGFASDTFCSFLRLQQLKLIYGAFGRSYAGIKTPQDVFVKKIVKHTVCGHYYKVSSWIHNVLGIKCHIRKLLVRSTLVWNVEFILLLFRPESLCENHLIIL